MDDDIKELAVSVAERHNVEDAQGFCLLFLWYVVSKLRNSNRFSSVS
jgi:hypothetical protein